MNNLSNLGKDFAMSAPAEAVQGITILNRLLSSAQEIEAQAEDNSEDNQDVNEYSAKDWISSIFTSSYNSSKDDIETSCFTELRGPPQAFVISVRSLPTTEKYYFSTFWVGGSYVTPRPTTNLPSIYLVHFEQFIC